MGHSNPLLRDFYRLMKNIGSFSNNQAKVVDYGDDMTEFKVEIVPNDGPYCRGKFEFTVKPRNYPTEPPKVQCLTQIYHPNIDFEEEEVCLSLFDEWTETNDLEDCVQGLLFLFYNPNVDDPLSPLFDKSYEWEHGSFENNVKASLEGELEVEGTVFKRNIVKDESNNEHGEKTSEMSDRTEINTTTDDRTTTTSNNTPDEYVDDKLTSDVVKDEFCKPKTESHDKSDENSPEYVHETRELEPNNSQENQVVLLVGEMGYCT